MRRKGIALLALSGIASITLLFNAFAQAESKLSDDTVIVRVNDTTYTKNELKYVASRLLSSIQNAEQEVVMNNIIEFLVRETLLAEEGKALNFDQEEDYQLRLSDFKRALLGEFALQDFLKKADLEDEINTAYDMLSAYESEQEERHLRHILVAEKEDAIAIINQLKEGASFKGLAQDYSEDPLADSGGDLGWIRQDVLIPEFASAAFSIDINTYSNEPVETPFGWHVIYVEDSRMASAPPLAEIYSAVERQALMNLQAEYITDLVENADIEYLIPADQLDLEDLLKEF